eukprot:SAG31_NODE_56_length_29726_cov_41.443312_24_plen_112_part_00
MERLEPAKVEHRRSPLFISQRKSYRRMLFQRQAAGRGWIWQNIASDVETNAKLLCGLFCNATNPPTRCAGQHARVTGGCGGRSGIVALASGRCAIGTAARQGLRIRTAYTP